MKLILLRRITISMILINLISNTYSQTIEKKTYQTAFTQSAPEIDGLMNVSAGILCLGAVILFKPNLTKTNLRRSKLHLRYFSTIITCMYLFVPSILNRKK